MSSRLRIVVTGQIAQYPLGGVTWFYLQYVLGLARLGHDVYYIEDSGQWPYSPVTDGVVYDELQAIKRGRYGPCRGSPPGAGADGDGTKALTQLALADLGV